MLVYILTIVLDVPGGIIPIGPVLLAYQFLVIFLDFMVIAYMYLKIALSGT